MFTVLFNYILFNINICKSKINYIHKFYIYMLFIMHKCNIITDFVIGKP